MKRNKTPQKFTAWALVAMLFASVFLSVPVMALAQEAEPVAQVEQAEPVAEAAEPQPAAQPEPAPEPSPEPAPEPEPVPAPEPQPQAEPAPAPQEAAPEPADTPEPAAAPQPEAAPRQAEPEASEPAAEMAAVIFYDAAGAVFAQQEVALGSLITAPADAPAAPAGQLFDGWRLENTEEKFDFANTAIGGETKLYPVFVQDESAPPASEAAPESQPQEAPKAAPAAEPEEAQAAEEAAPAAESDECEVTFVVDGAVVETMTLAISAQAVSKDA